MIEDLDRTTAAVLAADQAHLTRMQEDTTWVHGGPLGHLSNADRRGGGWRHLFARRRLF
jgi:hypothetical protein